MKKTKNRIMPPLGVRGLSPLRGLGGFLLLWSLGFSCTSPKTQEQKKEAPLFELVAAEKSGVKFNNALTPTPEFNIFKYLYFYNGAGVATADFNNDGLPDIYFTSNQGQDKLYLNKGNLQFEDITEQAGLTESEGNWTTGVTVADVNGDGRLDIYVSQLGNYEGIFGKNLLYINSPTSGTGGLQFKEEGKKYGLDLVGFSTQAAFFDYDLDGDLDMFMLNHSVHANGTFERRVKLRETEHKLAGDKLLRNDNGKFTDVSKTAGISQSALGYGLGISTGDVNNDGYPDIYVGNDFHENDYLYINQRDGTFKEMLQECMQHTSKYSMGTDIADVNNDGLQDIISLDMLPEKYETLKASDAEDPYTVYEYKLNYGYNYQYSRNTLQLNQGNNTFSEVGMFAGIHSTDWSWSALFADYDLDGYKDLFISNGIPRRLNDLDYIKFVSDDVAVQMRLENGQLTSKDLALVNKMPEIKIPNYLYRNLGNLRFENMAEKWGMNTPTYSSGTAYADLDNDGDLELIINNTNDIAHIYKNLSRERKPEHNYLKIKFEGDSLNKFGIGAKIIAPTRYGTLTQEQYATRGFQSAVDLAMTLGLGEMKELDSLTVIWADRSFQTLKKVKSNQTLILKQKDAQGQYKFPAQTPEKPLFEEFTERLKIDYTHQENNFVEFNREQLIPHMVSREGPALAVGDVDGDGKADFFVGGAKHQAGKLFIQTESGFTWQKNADISADSVAEGVKAEFVDVDGDKDLDLLVLNGGNEFAGKAEPNRPCLYLNDGKGNFERDKTAFRDVFLTGGALATADFDKDGDIDIFLGARATTWKYGITPESYLLVNDGKGHFKNITATVPELQKVGMVKSAEWGDLDKNGYPDLVIAGEWFPVTIFMNEKGKLQKANPESAGLAKSNGLWNTIKLADTDADGDLDIIAGNLGLNSKLKADLAHPMQMFVADFDDNGQVEQLLYTYYQGANRLFATKDELAKQMPSLNKKFLSYKTYAQTPPDKVIEPAKLAKALQLNVFELRSGVFKNNGRGTFTFEPLPDEVQFSPVNAILEYDFDQDGRKEWLLGDNFYDTNIQMGRYDAGYGTLLKADGKGKLAVIPNRTTGLLLKGQIRALALLNFQQDILVMVGRNKESLQLLKVKGRRIQ
jgi:hypothetical protein